MSPGRYVFGPVTWYSFLILCGMVLAIFLAGREAKRRGLPDDTVIDLALIIIPAGLLGARLYYVLFTLENYLRDPIRILFIWEGGLAIYGGLIAGALAAWLYTRRKRLSLLTVLDVVSPGVALAQAIGRWGNFFNSEAYGQPITHPALQFFPFGVLIEEQGALVWHQATFFYESLWNLLVFVFLWTTRKRVRRNGDTFLWYALLYAAGRQLIEGLRTDSLYSLSGGFRVSQVLAIVLAAGVLLIFILRAKADRRVWLTGGAAVLVCAAAALAERLLALGAPGLFTPAVLLSVIAAALLIYRRIPPVEEAVHADR